jgi:hypothetical protein
METQIIGVKKLYKELKSITEKALEGQSFLVVKNSKPIFRIEPIREIGAKKYNLSDAKKLQFVARDKNLSKNMDKSIY